jgi:hypothetical protein
MTVKDRMLRLIERQGPWSTLGKVAAAIIEHERRIDAAHRALLFKEA